MMNETKIATRQGYAEALAELGGLHTDVVVLDADLAEATKTALFRERYPDRHIECGIAEANMMGVAAGMAACKKVPFVSTFAMFAAGRAFEQIRNSIAYPGLNVKIGATHAGISVGPDGATHQCNEDIALMRSIPGMVVVQPCDAEEAKAVVKAAYVYHGPVYMRLSRFPVPVVNRQPGYEVALGKGVVLREGSDLTLASSGIMVSESLKAADALEKQGIRVEVLNFHTIKPLDEELLLKSAGKTGCVVTVEEHSVVGGLGSAVCDVLSQKCPSRVMKIGIEDTFGESGPAEELLEKYGLCASCICKRIYQWMN